MGFFESHDTATSNQEGNNSGGSVIDLQQSGDIPVFFWVGFFAIIGGIAFFACWRYNKTRNFKLRAKYGVPKPTAPPRPRDEVTDYGNPVDKYFLRRDRRRQEKNAIWGRMQEIQSGEEGDFHTGVSDQGQQEHGYVDKIRRPRAARQHPYRTSKARAEQVRERVRDLEERGIIQKPRPWEEFLPKNVDMHEVIDRLAVVAEKQRRQREQIQNSPRGSESDISLDSAAEEAARRNMWIYRPKKKYMSLQHDGMYA